MLLSRLSLCLLVMCSVCGPRSVLAHGSFHERVAALEGALKARPNDPQILYRLALEYHEHGQWEGALQQLERVDAAAPGVIATDLLRGRALAAGGKFAEARAALDRYLAQQPGHAIALTVRARVYSELGQAEEAARDAAAAVAATPQPEPEAYFEWASFLVAAKRPADAVKALDEGLTRLGPIPALMERALQLELTLGRSDAALARVDAQLAAAPGPQQPVLLATRAQVLTAAGREAESRAAWEKLRAHLLALPPLERASHAMLRLAELANHALAAPSSP